MKLIHYSNQHLTEVQDQHHQTRCDGGMRGDRAMKPVGLWVSVEGENDWPSWCKAEGFALEALTHPTEIVLRPDANVLCLNGEQDIRAFHAEYGCRPFYADEIGKDALFHGTAVRWGLVAERYAGIIIAPYVWTLRLDDEVRWYYGWDCASGCIWKADAVAALQPLPIVPVTAEPAGELKARLLSPEALPGQPEEPEPC
jgi:hypothetical protein